MSSKAESVRTITTIVAAKSIGVDENFIIDKLKEGKILSIEVGNEMTTKYYVFDSSFQKYVKDVNEKISEDLKKKEMSEAASAGRKLICFKCDFLKTLLPGKNEIWMSWRGALADYSIEKLIVMAGSHFNIDLSFLKDYKAESEHFTYKASNVVSTFEFTKQFDSSGNFYYIACIVFTKEAEEKKDEKPVEKVDSPAVTEAKKELKAALVQYFSDPEL